MDKKKKNYNPNGRYSPDSSIEHKNQSQRDRYGPLDNEGEIWTNEQMDLALRLFLIDEIPWQGDVSLCTELGRTYKGIETQLQKMAFCYDTKEAAFKPSQPYAREGEQLSRREMWLIQLAVGETWRRKDAYKTEYLSRILMRPMWELNDLLDDLAHDWGLGIDKPSSDKELDRAIRIDGKLCKWHSDWMKGGKFNWRDVGGRPRRKGII